MDATASLCSITTDVFAPASVAVIRSDVGRGKRKASHVVQQRPFGHGDVIKLLTLGVYGSSQDSQSSQALLDKISELADASGIQSKGFMSALSEFSVSKFTCHLKKVGQFLHGQVGLEKGVNVVITNRRVVRVPDAVTFLSQDLHLLESVELKQRVYRDQREVHQQKPPYPKQTPHMCHRRRHATPRLLRHHP